MRAELRAILPSAGQGYQMLQRLRPTGGEKGGARDPSGEVFSERTLELLLRAQDIPPFWRKKLIAISYNPIGMRQTIQQLQLKTITPEQGYEQYQDAGFSPQSARKMVELAEARIKQQELKDRRRQGVYSSLDFLNVVSGFVGSTQRGID